MDLFNHVTALAALSVVLVQQILKAKFIPIAFANRYPVPASILLSIVAAVVTAWQSKTVNPQSWTDWIVFVATIAVIAALTYNNTVRNWDQLRETEGPGK